MKQFNIFLVLAFCHLGFLSSCKAVANEVIESPVMRSQADAFLKNMPVGLQDRQTAAILKAIDGDNSELEAVRNSRNTAPKISENVSVKMLSPIMRLYEPKDSVDDKLPILIYFHGGGWTFGSLNSCGSFCNAVASSGRVKVLAVDYRLAPENPFPAGLEDCISSLQYVVDNANKLGIDYTKITLGGDSSGGNLAIAVAISEGSLVESIVVFYPVTKAFNDGSASWKEYGVGYGLDSSIMDAFNKAYAGEEDSRDLLVSVGLNDERTLKTLPRTLLIAAGRDILCDQGAVFARKSSKRVKRIEFKDAVHLFITVPGQDEAFEKAVQYALDFIDNK